MLLSPQTCSARRRTCSTVTRFSTNPTWSGLGLNPVLCGERQMSTWVLGTSHKGKGIQFSFTVLFSRIQRLRIGRPGRGGSIETGSETYPATHPVVTRALSLGLSGRGVRLITRQRLKAPLSYTFSLRCA